MERALKPVTMQQDLRTLIRNSQWKQDAGLFIPAYLNKTMLSVVDVSSAVFLTYEEIFEAKYTKEEFKNDLSQLTIEDCLVLTSRILTILENEGFLNPTAQKRLSQELFAGNLRVKILHILSTQPERVVFFETQLLLVAKYALLYAKNEPANNFMERKLFPLYMKIILGVTDLLDSGNHSKTEMQRVALRSMYFHSKPDFFYSLRRAEDLFITIPNELTTHPQYLDIPALFQEATGLTLEDYLLLGSSLTALLMQQKFNQVKESNWCISPETFFAKSIVPQEEIVLLMKEFAIDIETLQSLYISQEDFAFNFNGLVQHPLVTNSSRDTYYPLSFSFLKEKITYQIYWILFDYIKKVYGDKKISGELAEKFSSFFLKREDINLSAERANNKKKVLQVKPLSRYTNFMGACFEDYVYQLLRRIYPLSQLLDNMLFRELVYTQKSDVKTADNILAYRSSLILIEIKVSQLNVYSTGILGNLDAFRKDIRKIVVDAFLTIQRTKEDFQKGLLKKALPIEPNSIKTFYPVLITYGKFIMFPTIWEIVEEEINKIPDEIPDYVPDQELLNRLQIIQADEIELLEAFLLTSGISLEELLMRKNADNIFKSLPFHNYIHYQFSGNERLTSRYQEQKHTEFFEKLKAKTISEQILDDRG